MHHFAYERKHTPPPPPPSQPAAHLAQGISVAWPGRELSRDALAGAVMANTGGMATDFFYSHHTFTHQNLDNATRVGGEPRRC